MTKKTVNTALIPLVNAATRKDAKWLKLLLGSEDAVAMFSTLDSELFVQGNDVPGSILMTSAVRGEGRTSLAVLLAAFSAIQDTKRKILLVDVDMASGGLADIFDLNDSPGLFNYFDDQTSFSEHKHLSALPNLWVTPLGEAANGASLFSPQAFQQFMDEARSEFDLVIVDAPAASTSKSISTMAKIVHNCVIVVRYGGPTHEQIAVLQSDLNRVGVNVLGCVLNQHELVVPGFLYGSR